MKTGRVGFPGVISSRVPHYPAYGFDSVAPSMRNGFAVFQRRYRVRGIVQGGSNRDQRPVLLSSHASLSAMAIAQKIRSLPAL